MAKKDFSKFTKRNVHKRRSKEEARRELLRALNQCGVSYDGVKIRESDDRGGHRRREDKEDILAKGIFSGSSGGYGFVSLEEGGDDIFIPAGNHKGAIDGDFVEIAYHKFKSREGREKTEGRVLKIIEYGRKTVIGRLCEEMTRHGRRYFRSFYVMPDDRKIMLRPAVRDLGGARLDDKVEALILRDGSAHPQCDIIRIFGADDTREANYDAILADCGIVTDFTPEELSEAERLSAEPLSREGREDLTDEVIFTIDGAGAKDLDDAISLRRLSGGGWRLGVHIADVSHYVTERTPLDRCAMQRGSSVYFTDKVVPMLPPALSNGACSLNSGEDKYTISAFISLDSMGEIKSVRLAPTVIRSRVRGVYSEVNDLLAAKASAEIKKKYAPVKPTLEKMRELYHILEEKSQKRGAIDFDSDEAVILLDDNGEPVSIEKRERGLSERIIEQFMITANEAVAKHLSEQGIPCVYRVHEAPPADAFESFLSYLDSLGFKTFHLRKGKPDARILSALLDEANERGLGEAVSYTMLRSMAKAKYSEIRESHFGLGIEFYCHFTSPIRRLSDLATHRIIKRVLFEGKRPQNYASYARRAAVAATEGELRALNAERKIDDLYKVIYMSNYVGKTFSATVSSITQFGMFCSLENTCEGLVPISEMPGLFTFDERNLTLRCGNKIYRIADKLTVRLEEANISRGKLRFSIVESK